MNRRGFFGALAAVVAAPFTAKPVNVVPLSDWTIETEPGPVCVQTYGATDEAVRFYHIAGEWVAVGYRVDGSMEDQ